MPARYRDDLNDGCVLTKGRDHQLVIYPTDAYKRKAELMEELPDTSIARQERRTFFGSSDHQMMDKAGRILVKQELRDWAGLELTEEIALVGVNRSIEVWNRTKYLEAREKAEESYVGEEVSPVI